MNFQQIQTKRDSFNNEYVVVDSNDFIETIMLFTRRFVAMKCTTIRSNIEFNSHFNIASQNIAINIFHMTREHEMRRFYIDDIRDCVNTYFAHD